MKSKKTNAKRQVVSHTVQPVVGPELTGITLKFNSGRVELTVEEAKSLYASLDSIFGPKYFPPLIIIPPAQQAARWKSCYHELIMAVGNKYDGESRHETALRYIRQAEAVGSTPCESNPTVDPRPTGKGEKE
jgi:hypothetical protein